MRNEKEFLSAVTERMSVIRKKKRDRIRVAVSAAAVFAVTASVLALYPWKKIPEAGTTSGGVIIEGVDGVENMKDVVTDSVPNMLYGTGGVPTVPEDEIAENITDDDHDSLKNEEIYGNPTGAEVYFSEGDRVALDADSAEKLLTVIEDCFAGGTWYKDVSTESLPDIILTVCIGEERFEIFTDTSVRKNGGETRIIGEDGVSKILAVIENITAE